MNWKRIPILLLILVSMLVMGLPFVQAGGGGGGDTTPVNTGQWFAVYYPNENLSGNPVAIQSEPTIGGNWGFGAPIASLPVDNWSARWTQTFTLPPGQYRVAVTADDGVRVYANNNLILNEWHGHLPQTYTADFNAGNDPITISVEYFDSVAQAYLTFELGRVSSTGGAIPTGTTATVLYNQTSGYFEPSTTAPVSYLFPSGVTYRVLSVSPDGQWIQLDVNGVAVWLRMQDVRINGVIVQPPTAIPATPIPPIFIPPTPTAQTPPISQGYPRATVNTQILNVREAPDPGSRVITQIRQGETYTVRRGSINGWLQLIVNGQLGWVSSDLVVLDTTQNLVNLAGTATATVRAARLNVRERPNLMSNIVGKINRLENHAIVGTDATRQWLLLDVNGTFGWVNRDYMDVNAAFQLPVVSDIPPTIPPAREYIVATASPYNVNIRTGAGTNFADIGNFNRGDDARIIGRTADNNWWQIEYNGIQGWVAASFALIQSNADINAIPVTGVTGQS